MRSMHTTLASRSATTLLSRVCILNTTSVEYY